jgi:site-specific recombinase XerD
MSPRNEQNLAELTAKYLNYQELARTASKLTSKSYANDLNQFLHPLRLGPIIFQDGKWRVSQPGGPLISSPLTSQLLKGLIRQAQNRWSSLSPASRNRKNACLKSFFKWLLQEGSIQEDLSSQVVCPRVPSKIPHFLSLDEALALVQNLKVSREPNRNRDLALTLLLYGAGLRVSEAANLKWSDVDLREKLIRVKGKGGKERVVGLVRLLVEALDNLDRNGKFVFGEKALGTRAAYEIIRRSGIAAGLLTPLHPHSLRHSFATHMLSSGTDLRILQELLGHESLVATQKYLHLSIESLSRTMELNHPLGARKKLK